MIPEWVVVGIAVATCIGLSIGLVGMLAILVKLVARLVEELEGRD